MIGAASVTTRSSSAAFPRPASRRSACAPGEAVITGLGLDGGRRQSTEHPAARYAARGDSQRSARHAVRRRLDERHGALHHQQAGSVEAVVRVQRLGCQREGRQRVVSRAKPWPIVPHHRGQARHARGGVGRYRRWLHRSDAATASSTTTSTTRPCGARGCRWPRRSPTQLKVTVMGLYQESEADGSQYFEFSAGRLTDISPTQEPFEDEIKLFSVIADAPRFRHLHRDQVVHGSASCTSRVIVRRPRVSPRRCRSCVSPGQDISNLSSEVPFRVVVDGPFQSSAVCSMPSTSPRYTTPPCSCSTIAASPDASSTRTAWPVTTPGTASIRRSTRPISTSSRCSPGRIQVRRAMDRHGGRPLLRRGYLRGQDRDAGR